MAPKWGDRIAIGDLQNDDVCWTFLSNVVSKYISFHQLIFKTVDIISHLYIIWKL